MGEGSIWMGGGGGVLETEEVEMGDSTKSHSCDLEFWMFSFFLFFFAAGFYIR